MIYLHLIMHTITSPGSFGNPDKNLLRFFSPHNKSPGLFQGNQDLLPSALDYIIAKKSKNFQCSFKIIQVYRILINLRRICAPLFAFRRQFFVLDGSWTGKMPPRRRIHLSGGRISPVSSARSAIRRQFSSGDFAPPGRCRTGRFCTADIRFERRSPEVF